MSTAYNDVMNRIENSKQGDKKLVIKVLSWLFYVARPLLMGELLEALVVEDGDRELHREYMLEPEDIIECCKSLVICEASTGLVRFTHYTLQEFLQNFRPNLLSIKQIAKTCLDYLSFDVFDECPDNTSMQTLVDDYMFGMYAAEFWASHVRGEGDQSPEIQLAVIQVWGSERRRHSIAQMYFDTWRRMNLETGTLLHILAEFGLLETSKRVLNAKKLSQSKNKYL
jgi:hypothetical protein